MSTTHATDEKPEGQSLEPTFLVGSAQVNRAIIDTCEFAHTLAAWHADAKTVIVIALTCKRWGCRHCGPRRARHLGHRVQAAKPNKLVTLTVNPQCHESPQEAWEITRRKLADLTKQIRRDYGPAEHLRVLEVTAKGWPHYHLVARWPYVPQAQLSRRWMLLTGAPIVDLRKIKRVDDVHNYVMKYLCKQHYVPWTNRRISVTKGFWDKSDTEKTQAWPLVHTKRYKGHPSAVLEDYYAGCTATRITPTAWQITPEQI